MQISNIKINGLVNPIGYDFSSIVCSWKVCDAKGQRQQDATIEVAKEPDFQEAIVSIQGSELKSSGEKIELIAEPCTRYYVRITVKDEQDDSAISEPAYFETGKQNQAWQGQFIGTQIEDRFHPEFVKSFSLEKPVRRARIYLTGLGVYEAYLNGTKIGQEFLAPFCNDYRYGIQYQTYDIGFLLKEENELCILTGNGWYKGRFGYGGDREIWGDEFAVIAEVQIIYEDDSTDCMGTDASWQYRGSMIESSDIYNGEVYHRLLWEGKENTLSPVRVLDMDIEKIKERYSMPLVIKEFIPVQEVIHTPAGETVLDMGQNFAGFLQINKELPKGCQVTFDHGEILQEGNFYNANYRSAKARFVYISDGTEKEVHPRFTFFGFRHVRVTGWPEDIKSQYFTGCVLYSDMDTTITFMSSDKQLNRLAANVMWSHKSNFIDMPMDCPQRDERLGWTGDAQVFAPTACYHMDTRAFFHKFLHDLHLEQMQQNGAVPGYIPNVFGGPVGSSVWGDAATFIPMTLYQHYGDAEILAVHYPMMKEWVDYIIRGDKERGEQHLFEFNFHYGDWLALDGISDQDPKGGTDDYFIASVYYYVSCQNVAKAADILGFQEERDYYHEKAEKIYAAILDEYIAPSGRLAIDTQAAYLISLKFGVYRNQQKVIAGLKERFRKDCYKIKCGFVGAPMMCQVLAESGLTELAYYFLFQQGYPGWLHCVNLGATTIWERWNSVLEDGTISGTGMNSLNHYAYGAVMEYVYRFIAGIRELEPGFKRVQISPQLSWRLSHVYLAYDSIHGKYVSEWSINEDGTVSIHVEVPFDCEAVLELPECSGKTIGLKAGRYDYQYIPDRDLRCKYTMETRLHEMQEDGQALEILRRDLPIAAKLIDDQEVVFLNMTLAELPQMGFMGFSSEMVERAAKQLLELRAF